MAIKDKKISVVYPGRDVTSLSDRPNQDGMKAPELKARFDQLNKELFPKYNELIDELNDDVLPLKADKEITINGHPLSADVVVTKGDVGLGNADNTSDLDKPLSTASTNALALKADKAITINGHALSENVVVSKADVGLGNADNTSDANKPVSTAQAEALALKADKSTTYTKTEMQTSGSSLMHWDNLTNKPNFGDFHWKAPVANRASLPLTDNVLGDNRVVLDDGDGKQAVYTCIAITGNVDAQWSKVADVDWMTEEQTRITQELARVSAENTRASTEGLRVTAEQGRVSAEGLRATAEGLRVSAEQGRASAESTRVTKETGRVNAEGVRESSELLRIENEVARNTFVEYSGSTAYQAGNKVSYLGSSYVAKSNTTGNLPTNTTYWLLIAQKGDNTTASDVTFTPTGELSSTNVQNALAELDTEKASKTEVYSLLNQDRRIFGVSWNGTSSPVLTRTGYAVGLTAQVGIDNQVVVNDFDNLPIWRWDDVTDNLGNVFKRIPKFYIRKTAVGDARTWEVSQYKGDGFYLPWCFWDFVNNKELDYVDVGKYQASKSVDNKLESKPLTYPLVNTSIVNFRTYARANGAGYGQFDIHVADALQTLFLVEFATLNSQAVMPGFTNGKYEATRLAVLTETAVNRVVLANANADVFKVGQPISIGTTQGGNQVFYGRTITAINVVDASNKELVFDGDPVNITAGNMVYNTGWRSGWSSAVLAKSGTIIANDGFYPMMYRGIESLYGDVWKWVDGVNITANQAWVCENQDQYVSNLFTAPYKILSYLNKNANGYPSKMGMDFANPFANFPVETSGGSTTFYSDYYYQNTGQYVALLGGLWSSGAHAGLFSWYLSHTSSDTSILLGGRLLKKAS